jgi:cytochrome c-type biogenesis protein CcmF
MANFGNFCLLFALSLAGYSLFAALIGATQRRPRIVRSAEHAAYAATACVTAAFVSLLYLILGNDFSTAHVANSSNRDLPVLYKISAIWGAHDGSMLLWVFFTALFCAVVIFQNRFRYRDMMPYVLAVLMFDLCFFLALNLSLSNPFKQLMQVSPDGTMQAFVPADGRGLNPLLQYWAMVIHPPILYLGFIGFLVPFAFAIGALATRQLGDTWIRTTRRWTLLTWLLLGVGLILGGKWAYVVLGWGGYWGWDPVENSSLMPWLVSTAFLHSVVVQERRGMLKVWNFILVVLTYLLGIFGTYLTRSGVIKNSVHAFAESELGKFFIYFMVIVLLGSLLLILWRRSYLKTEQRLDSILSRESVFLFNNFVFIVACAAVFVGTMMPVLSTWFLGREVSVDLNWFNRMNVPIGLLLLLLTGLGPLLAWRKTSLESLRRALLLPAIFAGVTFSGLLAGGMRNVAPLICFALSSFVLAAIVEEFYKGTAVRVRSTGEGVLSAMATLIVKNKRRYGGYIVHFAIVLMFIGFAGNAFNRESTQQLTTGRVMQVGDYTLKMAGFREGEGAGYRYGQVSLEAYKEGKMLGILRPEQRIFNTGERQTTTTVALYSTPKEDLYVVFAGVSEDGMVCQIKAFVNPLVFWIWIGSVLMFIGAVICLLPEKSSRRSPVVSGQLAADIQQSSV